MNSTGVTSPKWELQDLDKEISANGAIYTKAR